MRIVDAFRIFIGFCLAAILFTPLILIGAFFPMRCRRSIFYWPWKLFSVLVCLVFRLRVNVTGQENIRQGYEKRHLFICNHQSALDIPILVSVFTIPFLDQAAKLMDSLLRPSRANGRKCYSRQKQQLRST